MDSGIFLGFAPLVHIITTGQTRCPLVGRTGNLYGVIQTNLTSFFPSGRVSRSSDVAITGDPRSCVIFSSIGGAELRRPRNEEFKVKRPSPEPVYLVLSGVETRPGRHQDNGGL